MTTTTRTTADNITDSQIRALRAEARAHGDDAQVSICTLALGGDETARAACAAVIAHAEAQQD